IDSHTCFNGHVFGLSEDGHVDVVVPLMSMAWKWIIRKNHHDLVNALRADIVVAQDQDETLPQWWGLVGVGRNFDGEAGNVCIKGDASAHTPDACAAPVSILGLSSSRTSVCISRGSLNRVEETQEFLRGRILARLRIRGMRRFNKTQRPKLRILMLDSALLAPLELVKGVFAPLSLLRLDCTLTFGRGTFGVFVSVLGDNLVDSWYRSRTLGHVVCGCMDFRPGTRRLDGISSWNLEAGRIFVLEPGGWMDFRPGSRRLDGVASWNPEAGWTFVLEPVGWMDLRPGTLRLLELFSRNLMVVWTFKGTFSYIFSTRSRLRRVGFLEQCFPLSKPGSVFQCVVQLPLGRLRDGTRCV
ncbi:LOW QUALITY PROTEIN: hypothetical protein HID58_048406, partial [Brassica napus]